MLSIALLFLEVKVANYQNGKLKSNRTFLCSQIVHKSITIQVSVLLEPNRAKEKKAELGLHCLQTQSTASL